ncbi:MAG: YfhO family protein [Oscillospiraceae bacterium]|jgi:uncharacterized membrane protein YfhO|nr:YfhO family protein [Oscillospiraceae bacterium]
MQFNLDLRERAKKPGYLQVFLIALATAAVVFVPFMIYDKGYFLLYGDFNVQQVPFYQLAHRAVKSGDVFWNWNTDLGSNFIASYDFYLLGSPYFWLTLPFPNSLVPYLMGPLLILKFASAATTSYAFFKRFLKRPEAAIIGGMLYAFSGFSIFNIFFNHFHEPMIFFPLLLVALEETVVNKRRGWLALAVFINLTVNYFFFIAEVIVCLIYFVLRVLSKEWRISLKTFLFMALEAILGFAMGMLLFLPSALVVLMNPRTEKHIGGWNALIYWDKYRPIHIIASFLFPPDLPARPNFAPESKAQWASLGAWLPLFGMTGLIAFMQSTSHKSWLKRIITLLFIFAFVPFLNQVFYMLNEAYYARWFYMLVLMIILGSMQALENKKTDWERAIRWSLAATLGFALPIAFFMKEKSKIDVFATLRDNDLSFALNMIVSKMGLSAYPDRLWIYLAIAMLCIFLLAIMLRFIKINGTKHAYPLIMSGVIVFSVLCSCYFITVGKNLSYNSRTFIRPYALNGGKDIDIPEKEAQNYRIDVYKSMDNIAMFWGLPSINAFHSIVPNSVMEFYPEVGVERGVATRPEVQYYALRSFLGVRWLFDEVGDKSVFGDPEGTETLMPGYTYYGRENGFDIWENDYWVPYGFTFNSYITKKEYQRLTELERTQMLLKAIVLEPEQVSRYGHLIEELDYSHSDFAFSYSPSSYDDEGTEIEDGYSNYYRDCLARKATAASEFTRDKNGFKAKISLEKANLVFFAVPWEEGWSAQVDGEPAAVERVDTGFMAVLAPQGEHTITFKYMPPGLKAGLYISLVAWLLFAAYFIIINGYAKKIISNLKGNTR